MIEPSDTPTEGQVWARCRDGKWQGWASGERPSSRGWEARRVSTVVLYGTKLKALEAATRLAVFMWGAIPLTVRLGGR